MPHFFGSALLRLSVRDLLCLVGAADTDDYLRHRRRAARKGVERYLELLRAGGSDYPMNLLKRAGVDLSTPAPAEAVVAQLDRRVTQLEQEIARL